MPSLNRAVFLDRDGTINHNVVRDGRPHGATLVSEAEIAQARAVLATMTGRLLAAKS